MKMFHASLAVLLGLAPIAHGDVPWKLSRQVSTAVVTGLSIAFSTDAARRFPEIGPAIRSIVSEIEEKQGHAKALEFAVFVDDVRQGNLRFDREARTITLTAWSGSTGAPLFIWTQDRDVVLAIGKSGSYLRVGLKPSADLREYEVVTMFHDRATWPTRRGRDAVTTFIDK